MQNEENQSPNSDKVEISKQGDSNQAADLAEKQKKRAEDLGSGLSRVLPRPASGEINETLKSKVEKIQSEYDQINARKNAISGITSAFGDLLSPKPNTQEVDNSKIASTDPGEKKSSED